MSYGCDWVCKCGGGNLDVRSKCRNCGEPNPSPAPERINPMKPESPAMDALLEAALNEYLQGLHATHRDCMRAAVEAVVEAYEAAKPAAVGGSGSRVLDHAERVLRLATEDRLASDTVEMNVGELAVIHGLVLSALASRLASLEAARSAEPVERPGAYFANLLQREWIGPDGIRYEPTRPRHKHDIDF